PWKQGLAADGGHYGDLAGELAAVGAGAIITPLLDQGLIRASGEEAAPFLHNLLTNDVKHLAPGQARIAGLCSAKGRMVADFVIWHDGNDLLLKLSADILPAILKKLSMYVLRSKVKLTDESSSKILLGVATPTPDGLSALLGQPVPPFASVAVTGGQAIGLDEGRALLCLTPEAAPAAWTEFAAKAKPVGLAAWKLGEIRAGRPRICAATQEAFVPQMVNFDHAAIGGVSYTKGCYPGQEVVARSHYLGKIKRHMFRARLETEAAAGTHVFAPETGNQHCGELVTVTPAPGGGYECLVVAQTTVVDQGDVRVGSLEGQKLQFLPLPYALE
ncbi:MAG: folate-binding protein, partial [Rhodocyclaceae bacterium]|nr:folate-binding protein [Rhodocyclaceae bacterium]